MLSASISLYFCFVPCSSAMVRGAFGVVLNQPCRRPSVSRTGGEACTETSEPSGWTPNGTNFSAAQSAGHIAIRTSGSRRAAPRCAATNRCLMASDIVTGGCALGRAGEVAFVLTGLHEAKRKFVRGQVCVAGRRLARVRGIAQERSFGLEHEARLL